METKQVTLEDLYNFMKMKFENIEYHLSLHDRQFEQLDRRMGSLEEKVENLEAKVQTLYDTRDKMKMEFSRRVLLGNSALSAIVAFFVTLITGRYSS